MKNDLTKVVFGNKLNKSFKLHEVLSMLDSMDLLEIGELAELAISIKSGVARCPKLTKNIDLVSGVQIKHAKTYFRDNQWKATVSRNTTAPMLVVLSESNTKKQYFMHLPYSAHSHLSGNTIGIPFGPNGAAPNIHWYQNHKVNSFKDLCELAK